MECRLLSLTVESLIFRISEAFLETGNHDLPSPRSARYLWRCARGVEYDNSSVGWNYLFRPRYVLYIGSP